MIFLNGVNITTSTFPNGELNLLAIEEAINSKEIYERNHFVMKYEDDKDLMALYFAKKHVDTRNKGISILSLAYMPYSRMDRTETVDTPFMLKIVCDFINELDFQEVFVHEPHSKVTVNLLNNVVAIYDNVDLIKSVKQQEGFNPTYDYIVFPDKGAMERYKGKIQSENMLFGKKKRDFDTGEIQGLELEGNTNKIHKYATAIICDDLSSYGGTFVRVSEELRKLGFYRVVLLVCHAENSIFKGKLFDHIDKVYATDSILTEHNYWENQKYKPQLKIFGMIEQMREGSYK